jgi:hypothetical protein
MLRARCGSALAETVYPDVVGNLYDPDELGQEGPPPRRRANVPRVPQDEPAGEVVDAPPPADPTPPAPVAAAQAVNAPSVEFLAGKPPAPVSETGAMLEGMMQGPSETASAPKPPEPPADAPAAPAASNGVLRSMRGLTLEEWKLLTEEQRAASKDVTRKQCVLISSLAKSKGINDLALIMGELRNDFTREFDEFGIKELWQVDSRIASYAIDQLKATPF